MLLLPLVLAAAGPAAADVHLNWVSHDGGVALLGGGPFTNASSVTLTSAAAGNGARVLCPQERRAHSSLSATVRHKPCARLICPD